MRICVHPLVVSGGAVPGEIRGHGAADHLPEDGGLALADVCRPGDRVVQRHGIQVPEHESGRGGFVVREIDHGVGEAARAADDGERAVAHAVHLVEAAGLVT